MAKLTLRFDFDGDRRIGPGKVELLEAVRATGSISTAARSLEMSYRRAWMLIEAMNQMFRQPVVETSHGGSRGGGATLTPFGEEIAARYRSAESRARQVLKADLQFLQRHLTRP